MSDVAERLLEYLTKVENAARDFRYNHVALTAPGVVEKVASQVHFNDWTPDAVLRHCTGAREIVFEVLSWKHFYPDEDAWFSCGLSVDPSEPEAEPGSGCSNDKDRGRCTCNLIGRQKKILRPLARSYGLELEGGPTNAQA